MTHKQPSGEARRPVADSTDALPDQVLSAYNRSLIEASLDPLVTISKDGKIMDVNAATETATGCSRKELIGTDFSQYFTEPEKAKEGYEQVFSNGFVRDYPLAIRSRSGKTTEVLYNATVYRDEDGEIRGVFAAARDITERKHMEEQLKLYSENLEEIVEQRTRSLRESEERYRSLVDSSPDGVIVRDGVRYVYVNSAFAKLLGASSPDQIIGKNILDFVHPDDREAVSARMPLGEQGRTQTVSKLLRLDKGSVDVEVAAAPAIWQSKPVVQAIIHDITERKQMEELKDRFISAVTHELRTPLVSIKGYTDYLLTGKLGTLSPKVESSIRTVKDASDRLLDLTNNLLDYRRLALGKFELNPEPIDMKDVVKTCIKEIHPTIENKRQRLDAQVGEESLPVHGDRTRLIQVVMNLLDNATKFTGENGMVTLRVEREAGFVKLVVSDNGIGIKDDDLARVFEPFAAIQKPSHIPGTGLGLSVAKGLVEAHGGNFKAESAGLGKGATFTIMIPLRKE